MNKNNTQFKRTDIAKMANKKPKGKRPNYFPDEMSEHSFSMIMSLMSELAVTRERADTLERLLIEKQILTADEIDCFTPDTQTGQERQLAHMEYVSRIMRSFQQQAESMKEKDQSIEEMIDVLGDPNAG